MTLPDHSQWVRWGDVAESVKDWAYTTLGILIAATAGASLGFTVFPPTPEQDRQPMNTENRTREDLAKRLVHALALADMEAMPEWDSEDEFWRFMVDKAVMPVIEDLQGRIDNVLTLLSQEGVALFHPQPTTLHEHPIPSFARDRIRAVLRGVQLEVSQ